MRLKDIFIGTVLALLWSFILAPYAPFWFAFGSYFFVGGFWVGTAFQKTDGVSSWFIFFFWPLSLVLCIPFIIFSLLGLESERSDENIQADKTF